VTGQGTLFDAEPVPAEPRPKESAGVRRTKRQRAMLEAGRHPLSSPLGYPLPLHAEAAPADDRAAPGRRCGNCRWRAPGLYQKCVLPGPGGQLPRVSHGPATDLRAWWPGCPDHEWSEQLQAAVTKSASRAEGDPGE